MKPGLSNIIQIKIQKFRQESKEFFLTLNYSRILPLRHQDTKNTRLMKITSNVTDQVQQDSIKVKLCVFVSWWLMNNSGDLFILEGQFKAIFHLTFYMFRNNLTVV